MVREQYTEADMEVLWFLADDVITTSGGGGMGEDPLPDIDL